MSTYPTFAAHQEAIWTQLSARLGDSWDGTKVRIDDGPWSLVMDSYNISSDDWKAGHTRMSAPYLNPEGFRFNIYEKGAFSWLGKLLGAQDIKVGDAPLDDAWVIQSNSPAKIRVFLEDQPIRDGIMAMPECELRLHDDEGEFDHPTEEGARFDELLFSCAGLLADPEQLARAYALFARALNRLCTLGSAYTDAP